MCLSCHQQALYVEGNAYDMGFLHGFLIENATEVRSSRSSDHPKEELLIALCTVCCAMAVQMMLIDYIDHFIPALISWKFDKKASNDPKWSKL